MVNLGAHQSISGGIHKAILRAKDIDTNILQIFTKNSNRWNGKKIDIDDLAKYFELIEKFNIEKVIGHAGYLINLASPEKDKIIKSIDSLKEDIDNCLQLKIDFLVLHPGSHKNTSENDGILRVAENLDKILNEYKKENIKILLETTAGQGNSIGYKISHLSLIKNSMNNSEKIMFCLDTCHLFAAGYDITNNYPQFKEELKKYIKIDLIPVIHLNDSKKELASRVDRHEHIGKGKIGLKGFSNILNDDDFKNSYFIIETPKKGEMDKINISTLKSLLTSNQLQIL